RHSEAKAPSGEYCYPDRRCILARIDAVGVRQAYSSLETGGVGRLRCCTISRFDAAIERCQAEPQCVGASLPTEPDSSRNQIGPPRGASPTERSQFSEGRSTLSIVKISIDVLRGSSLNPSSCWRALNKDGRSGISVVVAPGTGDDCAGSGVHSNWKVNSPKM